MKDNISWLANVSEEEQRVHGQPRFASSWRHQYCLAPKPGAPLDVIEVCLHGSLGGLPGGRLTRSGKWYIAMIRQQSQQDLLRRTAASQKEAWEKSKQTDMYWGFFWLELGYRAGPSFDDMTLEQIGRIEFAAMERILSRALPPI